MEKRKKKDLTPPPPPARAPLRPPRPPRGERGVAGGARIVGGPRPAAHLVRGAVPARPRGMGRGAGGVRVGRERVGGRGGVAAAAGHRLRGAPRRRQPPGQVAALGGPAPHHVRREARRAPQGPAGGGHGAPRGQGLVAPPAQGPSVRHHPGLLPRLHACAAAEQVGLLFSRVYRPIYSVIHLFIFSPDGVRVFLESLAFDVYLLEILSSTITFVAT